MFKTVSRIAKHVRCVQASLFAVVSEVTNRGIVHDASKFEEPELKGYLRFEQMPEGLEYGSEEYKQEMAKIMKDNDCFEIHSSTNDHHPEYWINNGGLENMPLFSIIEMVCDWCGAHTSYGNKSSWADSVTKNLQKYEFTESQRWAIYELAAFLYDRVPQLKEKE